MKYLILSFSLNLFALNVWSQQEFAPLGAAWEYHYIEGWTSDTGTLRVVYSGDTTILGKPCKRLCMSKEPTIFFPDHCPDGSLFPPLFIAQSNDSVFYSFGFSQFTYSFKLNYSLGDTVSFPQLYGPRKFAVTEMDTLFFNNQPIRRFKLYHSPPPFGGSLTTFVYDFFGPELGFFSSWWGVSVDGDSYYLCSYRDNGLAKIYLSGAHCSETVNLSLINGDTSRLVLSPNPTTDFLQVNYTGRWPSSHLQVAIYDAQGRLVLRDLVPANHDFFDVRHLQSGLYFVVVQAEGAELQQKFVKL